MIYFSTLVYLFHPKVTLWLLYYHKLQCIHIISRSNIPFSDHNISKAYNLLNVPIFTVQCHPCVLISLLMELKFPSVSYCLFAFPQLPWHCLLLSPASGKLPIQVKSKFLIILFCSHNLEWTGKMHILADLSHFNFIKKQTHVCTLAQPSNMYPATVHTEAHLFSQPIPGNYFELLTHKLRHI